MARRGGRRGRRSRSRQNRSRRSTRSTRSRRTTTRRSAPSSRRNTRTTTRASNRRATVSKARRAAPKRTAPKKKAPTARRAAPSNRRATVSKARRASAPKKTAPKKTTPTRTTQQRTNQRGVGARKTSTPKKAVNASVGKPATSKRQETRINRKPPTTFKKAVQKIQNRNLVAEAPKRKINPFNIFQTREAIKEGDAARKGKRPTVTDKPGLFDRMLNRNSETQRMIDQASAGGTRLAVAGNMTNLGIRNNEATAFKVKDPSSYGVKSPDTLGRDVSFGPVADGATYARNITNYGMKFGKTPEARGKAYEQSLDPKSFKGLSDGQTFGVGPVASGDAYARGLNTDNKNVENRLRQIRNIGSTLTGGLIPSVRKLTDKEIADRRIKNADFRRNNLMNRRRGSSGGTSRIAQQAAATQMQPEIAPTIGTPPAEEYIESVAPQGDLTRIQNQAYNTQLTSSLADMFGGQGSVGYTPQGDQALSPTLRAGRSRGRRRVRLFGARRRRGGTGDQFSRAGDRIARLTNINI